jgi:hypothetical protein
LFDATRSSLADSFTNIVPITELDTAIYDDWDLWVSEDGHYAVFGSDRTGEHRLFETSR